MIAYLKGHLREASQDHVVLDVQGVGYEVFCSQNTLTLISQSKGEAIELFIYTHVREDILQLFGFFARLEKELFLSLNKVNGIGPRMALKILSAAHTDQLVSMIESEDVAGLSRLPKVGKKTAEQMILALKGKLIFESEASSSQGSRREIVSALVNLGFKLTEVEKVVGQFSSHTEVEEGIKRGLAALSHL